MVSQQYENIDVLRVSQIQGDDAIADGSSLRPYRTITAALRKAGKGVKVALGPGMYDASQGEIFPLRLGEGVTLVTGALGARAEVHGIGEYRSSESGQAIQAAIVMAKGSRIDSVLVVAPGGVAVWSEEPETLVRDSELRESLDGIVVAGASDAKITHNLIAGNSGVGVEVFAAAIPMLRENTIEANRVGVAAHGASSPDLGRGSDPGLNKLSSNSDCTLANDTDRLLLAVGNDWATTLESVAVSTVCGAGVQIANTSRGVVAFRYAPATEQPLFSGAAPITTLLPEPAQVVATTTPRFGWEATGDSSVIVAVFANEPRLSGRKLLNPEAMVWAWFSGLPSGRDGEVAFKDGRSVHGGVLSATDPATPLDPGRAYSWAVWSWSGDPPVISRSSAVAMFGVP